MTAEATTYEVYIDLKSNGLTHVKGKSDKCDGDHLVKVSEDEIANLVLEMDPDPEAVAAAQKLHEAVHPEGAVFIENCTERMCTDLLDVL